MKVLVLENSLDDLLNVKISVNGGQSYTDYNVSSLKNGGLTLDCNPSDLKVICDTNILNYIKVFADGEKLNTGSGCGSNQTTIQELFVTENGTYNAGSNAAYNPVIVNVPSGGKDINASVAGTLLRYAVDNGASVSKGQTIIILELMKMEVEVKAPCNGTITFTAQTGSQVSEGQKLAVIWR